MIARIRLLTGHRKRISILLTITALLLWAHSILYARFEIGYFGLINGLPVTFFIALGFLTIASVILWVSDENGGKLPFLQLLILVSALWLVPVVIDGSPPFLDHAYRNLGMTDYIVRQGYFNPSILWYQLWPGAFILSAMMSEIGSINFQPVMIFFPFLMQLLYLLPLYVFLKNTLGEARSGYRWAGCWLFYLAEWVGQDYLGPQGIALFLFLTILALITSPSLQQRNAKSFALLSLAVIVFAVLVVTHPLTALVALCILAAFWLIRRSKAMAVAIIISVALLALWTMVETPGFIETRLERGIEEAATQTTTEEFSPTTTEELPPTTTEELPPTTTEEPSTAAVEEPTKIVQVFAPNLSYLVERSVSERMVGTEAHMAVNIARIVFSATFVAIGLIGAILFFITRKRLDVGIRVLAIAVVPSILLTAFGIYYFAYGREFLMRLYLFALTPMAFFATEFLKRRGTTLVLCALLLVLPVVHIVTHYGNQTIDYISPHEMAAASFFDDTTTHGYAVGRAPIGVLTNIEQYRHANMRQLDVEGDVLVWGRNMQSDWPQYISIGRAEREFYSFYLGRPEFIEEAEEMVSSSPKYRLIYNNSDMKLYFLEADIGSQAE